MSAGFQLNKFSATNQDITANTAIMATNLTTKSSFTRYRLQCCFNVDGILTVTLNGQDGEAWEGKTLLANKLYSGYISADKGWTLNFKFSATGKVKSLVVEEVI